MKHPAEKNPTPGLSRCIIPLCAVLLVLAACGGSSTTCWNLSVAEGLIGQASYTTATANPDGVDSQHISGPRGSVAISGTTLYVVDTLNSRILGYSAVPSGIAGAASFELGQGDATGTDFSDNSTNGGEYGLANPSKVSIATDDSTTYFVVTDTANNRVLIWNRIPTADDTAADLVLGQSGFITATSGIDTYSSTLLTYTMAMNQPSDLWTDGRGNLFIADTGNNRVLYYSVVPTGNNPQATYVIGQTAFGQNTSSSGAQHFDSPWGVYSDGSNLYVGDTGNNRVLQFSLSSLASGVDAEYVFGQEDFTHTAYNDDDQNGENGDQQNSQTNTDPTDNTLHSPKGVYATSGGVLYIADSGNNRVMQYASDAGVNGTDTSLCTTQTTTTQ